MNRPVIRCVGQVPDCPRCATEPTRRPWPHVCDRTCVDQAHNRATEAGHERSHTPQHHDCGALIDDRQGHRYERIDICGWGTCVQYLCPGCGAFLGGFGPTGCGCELQPCGHGSYDSVVATRTARRRLLDLITHH